MFEIYNVWQLNVVLLILLGLILASFLQALVFRIENYNSAEEILLSRSKCENCSKVLSPLELIPVVSYILQKGSCTKCKKPIGISTLLIEISLPLIFLYFYYLAMPLPYYLLGILLFFITIYDIKYQQIPKFAIQIFLFASIVYFGVSFHLFPVENGELAPIIAFIVALLLLFINLFKNAFGFGDILIIVAFGFLTYMYEPLLVFISANILALVFYIPAIILDKSFIKRKVAFVPFLSLGFLVSLSLGDLFNEYVTNLIHLFTLY